MRFVLTETMLAREGIGAYFRPRDVARLGVSFYDLQRSVSAGGVEKVGVGLYRLTAVEPNEVETIAMVGCAIPGGIICLLSALRIHEIGTQSPHAVWIALDRKARKPKEPGTRLRIVRFSGAMLRYGVVTQPMLGVPVRITSPARTIVDCFRYRNTIGLDVALEAMRDAFRTGTATVDQIVRAAEVCRARTIMQAYLETLAA